ncbi:MAG: PucR family transcriptional regulator ligand-binding domain-containing protein [Bacillota bacterium]
MSNPVGITVARALTLGVLQRSQLLAGREGLDRLICSVNVMEVPDIANFVQRGQLLVTTGFPLKDDPDALLNLVPILDAKGLAALAIKPLRYLPKVGPDVVRMGDQLAFPIIGLPADASFSDVLNPVLSAILNEQASRLQRAVDIHSSMTALVLSGGGLPAIASTLATLVDLPVAVLSSSLELLACGGSPKPGVPWEIRPLEDGKPPPGPVRLEGRLGDRPCNQLLYPVMVAGRHYGYIVIWELDKPLSPDHLVAVEHAGTVAALEMAKEREIREIERRYQSSFIDDLVTENYESPEAFLLRARNLGYDLSGGRVAMLLAIDDFEGFYLRLKDQAESAFQRVRERVTEIARFMAQSRSRSAIVAPRGDSVLVLYATQSPARAKSDSLRLAAAIKQKIAAEISSVTFSVGVGQFYESIRQVSRSFAEAKEALALGRAVFGRDRIIHYDDLGAYRILARLVGHPDLGRFCMETLGELARHDQQHGADLLHTLEAFLRHNGHLGNTARELHVHYNTLRYRIARIQEITGADLNDAEARFNLQVATKIARLGWDRPAPAGGKNH